MTVVKKLVLIGGGYDIPTAEGQINLLNETKEIDKEIVKLSGKKNPKFLFISIASRYPNEYFLSIKKIYDRLGCVVSHLDTNQNYDKIAEDMLDTDIIYIGGGNFERLMKNLREIGIDKLLIKAYNSWILCSWFSSGSYCRFKYNYNLVEWMGVLDAINCAHYEQKESEQKEKFYNVVKEKNLVWYGLDNCTALEIIDDEVKAIRSSNKRHVYKITCLGGKIIEEEMI